MKNLVVVSLLLLVAFSAQAQVHWTYVDKNTWRALALKNGDIITEPFNGADSGTTDDGHSWHALYVGGYNQLDCIDSDGYLYGQGSGHTYRTGPAFSLSDLENAPTIDLGVDSGVWIAATARGLFTSTKDVVLRSKDHGLSWDTVGKAQHTSFFVRFVSSDGRIFAYDSVGSVVVTEDGIEWTNLFPYFKVVDATITQSGSKIYIGIDPIGLFRISGTQAIPISNVGEFGTMLTDWPVLGFRGTHEQFFYAWGTMHHSPDDGQTWDFADPASPPFEFFTTSRGTTFYVAVRSSEGLFRYDPPSAAVQTSTAPRVAIVPNPCTARLNINGVNDGDRIEIVDAVGRNMYHGVAALTSLEVQSSTWPRGVYFVAISNERGSHRIPVSCE